MINEQTHTNADTHASLCKELRNLAHLKIKHVHQCLFMESLHRTHTSVLLMGPHVLSFALKQIHMHAQEKSNSFCSRLLFISATL